MATISSLLATVNAAKGRMNIAAQRMEGSQRQYAIAIHNSTDAMQKHELLVELARPLSKKEKRGVQDAVDEAKANVASTKAVLSQAEKARDAWVTKSDEAQVEVSHAQKMHDDAVADEAAMWWSDPTHSKESYVFSDLSEEPQTEQAVSTEQQGLSQPESQKSKRKQHKASTQNPEQYHPQTPKQKQKPKQKSPGVIQGSKPRWKNVKRLRTYADRAMACRDAIAMTLSD